MKKTIRKIAEVCKVIFGYGIMLCLFAGGLTSVGYIAALCIGGETAVYLCGLMKQITPFIVYTSTCVVLFGLLTMYLAGELALTPNKRKK